MMVSLTEGRLTFEFPADDIVTQYDDWSFYRNQFNGCFSGTKAVDFIYVDAHPRVVNQSSMQRDMRWTVTG